MEITKQKFSEAISENWIAVSSGAFVLYGIIYANIYYSSFSVPIFSYITITELISFFISDVHHFIILALFIFPLFINNQNRLRIDRIKNTLTELRNKLSVSSIEFNKAEEKLKSLEEVHDIETKDKLLNEIGVAQSRIEFFKSEVENYESQTNILNASLNRTKWIPTILFGSFILLIIIPLLVIDFRVFFLFALLTVVFFVGYIILKRLYIPLIFVIFVWSIFGALTEAYFVKRGKTIGYKIHLKTSPPLISDSTDYYIGKTEKFVFIHKTKEGLVEAHPTEEIEKISIPVQRRDMLYYLKKKLSIN